MDSFCKVVRSTRTSDSITVFYLIEEETLRQWGKTTDNLGLVLKNGLMRSPTDRAL